MAKYLIIGGVAGGATAAARLRRLDEKADIVILERGDHVSYANCGLPYYAGGVIKERSRLFVMTPERFRETLAVDVRTGHEAMAIDRAGKSVTVLEKSTGRTYLEGYDALVLSPGAEPVKPALPGIGDPRVFTLRTVADIDRIKEHLDARRPRNAVVIGGGFIGLEMAENLHARGVAVSIVEALDQVMNQIDFEMAAIVHRHLMDKGLGLSLSDPVSAFREEGGRLNVVLTSGRKLPAEMVILSIGVKPDTKLAREAGLRLDAKGAILVDESMRTSDPAIYAVGDAVAAVSPLTGAPATVPLAGPANKQARIAADRIVRGGPSSYKGAIGTSIAKVFDLTVACTGLTEKACARAAVPCRSVIVHPSSHAGYYPDARPFSLKVVFSPKDGKLLGAQAVGYEGVDKRIDVIAAYLSLGAGVEALTRFEHAYAPPYASAKDPVNYAGFVAENLLSGLSEQVPWSEVEPLKRKGAFLLDVRTPEEYALGHIEGASNIPNTVLRERLSEVPRDRFLLLYCGVGIRGYLAERILRQNGYPRLANLAGGWKTWEAATAPQDNAGAARAAETVAAPAPRPVAYAEGSGMPEAIAGRSAETIVLDACGLQCPGPIMRLKTEIDKAAAGATLVIRVTDPGFARDAKSWCNLTGNTLVGIEEKDGIFTATVRKGSGAKEAAEGLRASSGREATLIVFSDDFDRALASFVIANGAAASGKQVTMFFTFWGLSVIKRREKTRVRKDFLGRMFAMMLPRNAAKLSLSKMNMGGMGRAMMKGRMKSKNVDPLEVMMQSALAAGVRLVACQMSMDIMGVAREELMDGVEVGGVATYLEAADGANVNLFV